MIIALLGQQLIILVLLDIIVIRTVPNLFVYQELTVQPGTLVCILAPLDHIVQTHQRKYLVM